MFACFVMYEDFGPWESKWGLVEIKVVIYGSVIGKGGAKPGRLKKV